LVLEGSGFISEMNKICTQIPVGQPLILGASTMHLQGRTIRCLMCVQLYALSRGKEILPHDEFFVKINIFYFY